jgi:hypothetical protein
MERDRGRENRRGGRENGREREREGKRREGRGRRKIKERRNRRGGGDRIRTSGIVQYMIKFLAPPTHI